METKRITDCKKGIFVIMPKVFLLFFILLLFPPDSSAQSDLRDTVLERKSFGQEYLDEMDTNQDDTLDVSDIVKSAKTAPDTGLPSVSFEKASSEVREGDGTVNVKVNFSKTFAGMLKYNVSGTAVAGSDYGTLNGSVFANGRYTEIPITVNDDNVLEDGTETLVLTVCYNDGENLGYVPGASAQHIVYISDNDALWNGIIENNGMSLHFRMKIIQSPSGTEAGLIGDGYGIIPLRADKSEWTADSVYLDSDSFTAVADQIDIPDTLFGVELKRKLEFNANSGNEAHSIQPDFIKGALTESVTCPDGKGKQFEYTAEGTFTLIRQIPSVESEEIQFE